MIEDVFEFLSGREDANKIIINNKFKINSGKEAIKVNDEKIFEEKL